MQHSPVRAFCGASPDAVYTQVWIALSAYVLVAIVKKVLRLQEQLYAILQILSITLFESEPVAQALTGHQHAFCTNTVSNQLNLFHL
jgi:hypothetical protein